MATWDWPALPSFVPSEVVIGARTPKSAFASFFTGNRISISHLGDRYRCTVRLPGCTPDEGRIREAFFSEVASAGHKLRFGRLDGFEPRGTLRGNPTVSASVFPPFAGARSLTLETVAAAPGTNLLVNGDFASADLSMWPFVGAGVQRFRPFGGPQLAMYNYTPSFPAYAYQNVAITGGQTYRFSGVIEKQDPFLAGGNAGNGNRSFALVASPSGIIAEDTSWDEASAPGATSKALSITTAPGDNSLQLRAYAARGSTFYDDFVLSQGGGATLVGGDVLSLADQLVQVSWQGAVANAANGIMVVPLVLPVRRDIQVGTPAIWLRPAGRWQLLSDYVDFTYHRGRWQRPIELPFVEDI